jgi:hypothetical protein
MCFLGIQFHWVLFGAPGPTAVLRLIPLSAEEVAEELMIVVTGAVRDLAHAREIVAGSNEFQVRGPLLVRWASYLQLIARELGVELRLSEQHVIIGLRGVPEAFLEKPGPR